MFITEETIIRRKCGHELFSLRKGPGGQRRQRVFAQRCDACSDERVSRRSRAISISLDDVGLSYRSK